MGLRPREPLERGHQLDRTGLLDNICMISGDHTRLIGLVQSPELVSSYVRSGDRRRTGPVERASTRVGPKIPVPGPSHSVGRQALTYHIALSPKQSSQSAGINLRWCSCKRCRASPGPLPRRPPSHRQSNGRSPEEP
jgi:hypothetical protein